jgi:hypothetical protein
MRNRNFGERVVRSKTKEVSSSKRSFPSQYGGYVHKKFGEGGALNNPIKSPGERKGGGATGSSPCFSSSPVRNREMCPLERGFVDEVDCVRVPPSWPGSIEERRSAR